MFKICRLALTILLALVQITLSAKVRRKPPVQGYRDIVAKIKEAGPYGIGYSFTSNNRWKSIARRAVRSKNFRANGSELLGVPPVPGFDRLQWMERTINFQEDAPNTPMHRKPGNIEDKEQVRQNIMATEQWWAEHGEEEAEIQRTFAWRKYYSDTEASEEDSDSDSDEDSESGSDASGDDGKALMQTSSQISASNIVSTLAVTLIGLFVGSGITFAVLRVGHSASSAEEPLLA